MGLDNPIHLAILLMILLLVFGAKRLPEMGKSLGHGLRGFKDAINGDSAPASELTPMQSTPMQTAAVPAVAVPAVAVPAVAVPAVDVETKHDETVAA
jgi:sec-independent protein translocase protein TatA